MKVKKGVKNLVILSLRVGCLNMLWIRLGKTAAEERERGGEGLLV
jgi:hypothetical protein